MTFVRAYLRASTDDQDADRARGALARFAADQGFKIAAHYVEHESGATLKRPELFRLLADCQPGDVLLVEQIDRLSRLSAGDWRKLRLEIADRRVRVVAVDLPTSWQLAKGDPEDFSARMLEAINAMMLDMLAAIARKDYEDRRRRQAEGIVKAKGEAKYRGRVEDTKRNAGIVKMLRDGHSWSGIQAATGCSRSTLSRLNKRIAEAKE
jgi:DNA invertase Pin-like site-specific DNA recombinase